LPPRLGLTIPHDEIRVTEIARRAERQLATVDASIEDERRIAQRAERHHDRTRRDRVVHDLVPDQDLQRIRARGFTLAHRDDGLLWLQPHLRLCRGNEGGSIQRGYAVARRAA
jgi:hypothetical protein